ncbi:gamma-glutamylcyclotransferase family protein [Actinocorallia libanotica]|uniref:gamma-glutamylcyclotransferase family protein n=1 Tax=Actinocorallia libanotica TaxID=46162 RepID=UPI0031DCD940
MAPDVLFVYGPLQFPEILFALLGRVPSLIPAQAPGWRATALPNHVYPGLITAIATAPGCLITDLSPQEWRLLDAFEDPLYDLHQLTLSNGRHGWAYVCGPETEILPAPWSPEEFGQRHLATYVDRCAAWRRHYESRQAG